MKGQKRDSAHDLSDRIFRQPVRALARLWSGKRQPVFESVPVPDPDIIRVRRVTARRIESPGEDALPDLLGIGDQLPVLPRVVNDMPVGKTKSADDAVKNGEIINPPLIGSASGP